MEEIWKNIQNSFYSVSNKGNIKNTKTGLVLKTYSVSGGSLRVKLYINGKRKQCSIHRLVAQNFISNPDNKPEVDHINRNNKDNRVENLRWATREENCQNRLLISKEILDQIIDMSNSGMTSEEIFKKLKNLK